MKVIPESVSSQVFRYHLLRHALERFGKSPSCLDPVELEGARQRADKALALEARVLASAEADGVVVSDSAVDAAINEVLSRYVDEEEFYEDLRANGLTRDSLRGALERELKFDAVMRRVAAASAAVSELDVHLFYEMHLERFRIPEKRVGRHILITINSDFPENSREAALARIEKLGEDLIGCNCSEFAAVANAHSECPSAMEGGKLGDVQRGQLYPVLDAALFSLESGGCSDIVETELGFHLVYCEEVKAGETARLEQAAPRIREFLRERQARNCQKAWLAQLGRAVQES